MSDPTKPSTDRLLAFITRWKGNSAGEMSVAQQHFLELCEALGVPRPSPREAADEVYRFEMGVAVPGPRGAAPSVERIDVYRREHFIWENKQGSEAGDSRVGTARRGTNTWKVAMNKAFAQALRYARHINHRPPPFLVVCDVGHHFEVWSDFSGTAHQYADRPSRRFTLEELGKGDNAEFLRKVMTEPQALNPALFQTRVTREIAIELAALAAELERTGEPPGVVARFLMRCVFTMFAEDTELLPEKSFSTLLRNFLREPAGLLAQLEQLWQLMDQGGIIFGVVGRILRFNGGLFRGSCSVPLSQEAVAALSRAAERDWSQVEPTIFGTLVEAALDTRQRHSLGAHFTPRPYIERVVRATVMEPLRDDWLAVRGQVQALIGEGEPTAAARKRAIDTLSAFHSKLCRVRVLDPACGTGNFLYVTYDLLKDLEAEVLRELGDLGQRQEGLAGLAGASVSPAQLLGIERNSRAREIAELVIWIGHLQRTRRDRGSSAIVEPVLRELKNIEGRDAVLHWEGDPVPRKDEQGRPLTVWDMHSMKADPITGREVPDEAARITLFDYPGARAADWPEADFIVSNPPFIGNKRMRMALGDGYAEALRAAWPAVPSGVDLVMYWWERCATLCRAGKLRRFGLITTNSITQVTNRAVISPHLDAGLSLTYAIADHPWVSDGAAVRIAMTVAGRSGEGNARLGRVLREVENLEQEVPDVEVVDRPVERIHPDLKAGADVSSAVPLKANQGVCFQGVNLVGQGFRLTPEEVVTKGYDLANLPAVLRPYQNARDITQNGPPRYVIDFYGYTAEEARDSHPALYQHLLDTVKPERESKIGRSKDSDDYAQRWWEFAKVRGSMRIALSGLSWYVVTPRTARHRMFVAADKSLVPDCKLCVITIQDWSIAGVLSSKYHDRWSAAAGGWLGVGNDSTYNNVDCFSPFPFPPLTRMQREIIHGLAERLDRHRSRCQATVKKAHLTAQYNALSRAREAARGGPPLSAAERTFHEAAQIGVLRSLHDDLDAAVALAYGWPADLEDEEILSRLVALNRERAAEEAAGTIRWLRPDFQAPAQGPLSLPEAETPDSDDTGAEASPVALPPFPTDAGPRLIALRDALRSTDHPLSLAELRARFTNAGAKELREALDTITALGVAVAVGETWAIA